MSKANMAALKVEKALVAGLMAQGESDAGSRAKVGGRVVRGHWRRGRLVEQAAGQKWVDACEGFE